MIGIDEVGRGAIAGPLLVCAARLNKPIDGLKDSKLLAKQKREQLAIEIKENADIGYGWVSAATIDDIGLGEALKLASSLAIQDINPTSDEQIIIDGTVDFLPDLNCKCIPKADNLIAEVSAASIVAKVARDSHMCQLALIYPDYGFDKHVGYGTAAHKEAIKCHGLTAEHRKCYKINLR